MKILALLLTLIALASASSETLACAVVGDYDSWYQYGGSSKVNAVALPNDDATSYIEHMVLTRRQSYLLETSGIPAGSTINSVTVKSRHRSLEYPAGRFMSVFLRLGGTNNDSDGLPAIYNTWVDNATEIGRPGGGSWSLSDLTTLQVGVLVNTDDKVSSLTTLYAVIDYTGGGGGPATGDWWLMF